MKKVVDSLASFKNPSFISNSFTGYIGMVHFPTKLRWHFWRLEKYTTTYAWGSFTLQTRFWASIRAIMSTFGVILAVCTTEIIFAFDKKCYSFCELSLICEVFFSKLLGTKWNLPIFSMIEVIVGILMMIIFLSMLLSFLREYPVKFAQKVADQIKEFQIPNLPQQNQTDKKSEEVG